MKLILKQTILITAVCICMNTFSQTATLSGEITGYRTLVNDTIYLLEGFVYVKDGGILDIEEGTLIKGDKETKGSLIITRDGIILAAGTANQPIIFTSNQPAGSRAAGDWGGILILGNAPINSADINATDAGNQSVIEGGVDNADGDGQFGGTDPNDSRGGLQYVRIEYPGIAFLPGNEINGLTCGGVGNGTILENIQVSHSGDDAFEFFGGTVNAKYLVSHATLDDDFDTDNGFSGSLQFLVSLRDPNTADVSGSNGFESDNDATGSANTPITSGIISNATIIGPIQNEGDIINANFKRGAHLRRNTQLNIHNSIIVGFPSGIMIDGSACEGNADAGTLELKNIFIAGHTNNYELASGSTWDINSWFTNAAYENQILTSSSDIQLNDPYNYLNPDFRPMASSPVLGSASFSDDVFAGESFMNESVTYSGAFDGSYNWTGCWTNWDPQNTDYSTPISGSTTATEANFTYAGVYNSFTVNFTNTSVGADAYLWDFGVSGSDTDVSTEINPSYTYPGNGSYEVILVSLGCTADTISQSVIVDSSVAINEIQIISAITYFPNPVKDILHMNVFTAHHADVTLFVSDITGQIVSEIRTIKCDEGNNDIDLNLSRLSPGIYFVNMNSSAEKKTFKIIINK